MRTELYRTHPQSPVPADTRAGYGDAFFPCDAAYRVTARVTDSAPVPSPIPASTGGTFAFSRVGIARFELGETEHELELNWNEGYGGGILVAVADETSDRETYGGGRYVPDTVKGADLGTGGDRLVLDFNFAFNPSCAFDRRWACPGAGREPFAVAAGGWRARGRVIFSSPRRRRAVPPCEERSCRCAGPQPTAAPARRRSARSAIGTTPPWHRNGAER